jgi:1-acyl-sn-glycerol-3-phosphate acyltransferase
MMEYRLPEGRPLLRASRALYRGLERTLGEPGRMVHNAAAWGVSFGLMAAAFGLSAAATRVVPFSRTHGYISTPLMGMCLQAVGADMRLWVHRDLQVGRPCVFCQNHVSILDAHVASNALPHPFVGLMHDWQFRIPVYGWLMQISEGIPVPRRGVGRAAQMAAAARERASRGLSVLAFPEGHRTRTGHTGPFRSGVFHMARAAGLPVVPVAVRGLHAINQAGSWRFQPGPVDVWIGPPNETEGLDSVGIARCMEAVERDVGLWLAGDPEGRLRAASLEVRAWKRQVKMVDRSAPGFGVSRCSNESWRPPKG